MEEMNMGDSEMAFFRGKGGSGKTTGAVVQSSSHKPSMEGTFVYLNANPNMDNVIARVEAAGGKVLMPKMNIGEPWQHCFRFGHRKGTTSEFTQ